MAYIKGKKAILTFYKDGAYTPFMCATGMTITINTDFVETRTIGDGYWEKIAPQSKSYGISFSGLIELQQTSPVTFWLIENYDLQMLPVSYRAEFVDDVTALQKFVTGEAYIVTSVLNGVATGFASSSFELRGTGPLVITNSALTCNAELGPIEVGPGNPDVGASATVSYSGVVNAARLEYSVDGGPREVLFAPGAMGIFYLFGLADGPHTLEVRAVCFSGVDGESNELDFELTGGEPSSCALPGEISYSAVTSTSVTANWLAASPAPADGYYYELINTVTASVVVSGTTAGLSADFTGLTAGVAYQFRVRSICETGVSESGFTSDFITLLEGCNVPGSPVMSAITATTATATWTAPTPVPGSGYSWQVLNGVTVTDSGTTGSLSVNLTGLPSGASLTFKVKAICGVGSESGYNSTGFTTEAEGNNIDWAFSEDEGNGTLVIRVNGVDVVNETTAGVGNFTCDAGDSIQVFLTASSGTVTVDDLTASIQIVNESDSGITIGVFTTTSGHDYSITGEVTS